MEVSVVNCPSGVPDHNYDLFSYKQTALELNKNLFVLVPASMYYIKVRLDTDDG
jgi:hypothetical protein